jgi:hypothetical protein
VKAYMGYGGYRISAASQQTTFIASKQGPLHALVNEMFSARTMGDGTVGIIFALKKTTAGSIKIYNASGRLISQVFNGQIETGKTYETAVQGISTGVYYAVLSTQETNRILRINLTR